MRPERGGRTRSALRVQRVVERDAIERQCHMPPRHVRCTNSRRGPDTVARDNPRSHSRADYAPVALAPAPTPPPAAPPPPAPPPTAPPPPPSFETVSAAGQEQVTAWCSSGYTVVSGRFELVGSGWLPWYLMAYPSVDYYVRTDGPVTNGARQGWRATQILQNDGNLGYMSIRVYATCGRN